MTKQKFKQLEKESDKAYKFLWDFCMKHTTQEEEITAFFHNLNEYLEAEIELEKECDL